MPAKYFQKNIIYFLFSPLIFLSYSCHHSSMVWLDNLDIKSFSEGSSSPIIIQPGGDSIKIGNEYFSRGIGIRYTGVIPFYLNGKAKKFFALVGTNNIATNAKPIKFFVIGDKKILFEKAITKGNAPQKVEVDLSGVQRMGLLVINDRENGKRELSYWAEAKFEMADNKLPQHIPNAGPKYILTPQAGKNPKINSAKIFGATPGNPFLYTIAASGERPMQFFTENLPHGLKIDAATGIISGKILQRGIYSVILHAKNNAGESSQKLRIKIGDTICLTPPMGWNGWNSWAKDIDEQKVLASADAMVSKGLINYGWTYINIDDAWQGQRGGKFNAIQPNEKFPHFKKMIDHIHTLALKAGIYSTPWIASYAGYCGESSNRADGKFTDTIKNNKHQYRYVGKYKFEKNDAAQWADWGIDYLKYDWHIDTANAKIMSDALKQSGRDMVYSLSNSANFDHAADWEKLANCWRTGGDIRDSWISLYQCGFTINKWLPYSGPGHWNDPDMLIVGNISTGSSLHRTRLTADEQYTQISLWSLLSAPLLIGCPVEQLDSFTLNLLSNDEVINIDQDPLGQPAKLMAETNGVQIWMKPMEDGSYSVGLFNTDNFGKTPQSYFRWGDEKTKSFLFDFHKIDLKGKWKIRDVWRQKDVGIFDDSITVTIPFHGVQLLQMKVVRHSD